jgi:integrase
MKLTKRAVEALPTKPNKYVVFDAELPRFGVRVYPSGARVYVLKYRADGEQQWQRIGAHGAPWTADQARKEALSLLGEVARGRNPARRRREDREALTVSDLCDLYFAEGVAHKKPLTLKADRARAEHHIKPLLGKKRVTAVERADVERLLNDVARGRSPTLNGTRKSGSVVKGGRGVAAQCVTLLGTIMQFAIGRGLRTDNPAHGIKKPPVRRMQRFLSAEEIARLGAALKTETETSPFDCAAIALLLLTGCRKSEVLTLKWTYVDFERGLFALPDSKTREKVVYLNAPAVKLLKQIPRVTGNPYVIVGMRNSSHSMALDKVWSRVRRRAELEDVRLHDLRHSFASIGAGAALGLPIIGMLLGHSQPQTTARYAHLDADPVRRASNMIGNTIAAAMGDSVIRNIGHSR